MKRVNLSTEGRFSKLPTRSGFWGAVTRGNRLEQAWEKGLGAGLKNSSLRRRGRLQTQGGERIIIVGPYAKCGVSRDALWI